MALVDANYIFFFFEIGCNGQFQIGVFTLYHKLESCRPLKKLPSTTHIVPYVIVVFVNI